MTASNPQIFQSPCPICTSSSFRQLNHDWLFRCSKCGLLASSLQPSIPSERSKGGRLDENMRLAGLYEARKRSNKLILRHLEYYLGNTNHQILDVGCGHGLLVQDAQVSGFRAEG